MEDFSEVLILRSFQKNDPLRDQLQVACDTFKLSDGSPLPVRFVDVRNREEFVAALKDFNGALALFDGHGTHRRVESVGKIILADEDVDAWDFYPEINMPPIFFTCACDTHAVNRSHATPANGLLKCGARTVISTMLPVRGTTAASIGGRLLFRIFQLLPAIVGGSKPSTIRWDEVFSLIQRMAFVSEFLHAVTSVETIGEQKFLDVQAHCTFIIHNEGEDWYEAMLQYVAENTGMTTDQLVTLQNANLPFPEILKYVQLGSPESIIIGPEMPLAEWYIDSKPENVSAGSDGDG